MIFRQFLKSNPRRNFHVESIHNFHVDTPFRRNFDNFPLEISTSNRWGIDKDVSIGIPFNIKSINSTQKYSRILCLYSIYICYDVFVWYEFSNFFLNISNSKALMVCCIGKCAPSFTINEQSHVISSSCRFPLMQFFQICKMLYYK